MSFINNLNVVIFFSKDLHGGYWIFLDLKDGVDEPYYLFLWFIISFFLSLSVHSSISYNSAISFYIFLINPYVALSIYPILVSSIKANLFSFAKASKIIYSYSLFIFSTKPSIFN